MFKFALAGNPNCGKTTLFNSLTGSTAHVGNWPGVTVDKREGVYKDGNNRVDIVDLPGIYSLSPYTPEEVISRNFIIDEKPDCVINIVDATNLERNLYLTTQILEMDVPVVIALNMADVLLKNGEKVDTDLLSKKLGVPVVSISALKKENLKELMNEAIKVAALPRVGTTVLQNSPINKLIDVVRIALKDKQVSSPLFHAVKLVEMDEIEVEMHKELVPLVEEFKKTFADETFGTDFEALIADSRYKYIAKEFAPALKKKEVKPTGDKKEDLKKRLNTSDKIDRVLTNKWAAIPIFIAILLVIFHLTFAEDFLYLNAMGALGPEGIVTFAGTPFEGLFANGGISSPGVILMNFVNSITGLISSGIDSAFNAANLPENALWVQSFVVNGVLAGIFAVIGFLPQILCLFLFFSILEDTGYMARVAFILDRIFRRFGVSGRAFMPMIMGFGCSVPAMINTRTLAEEKERIATIRVIPFFSCGAKLPILTAVSGALLISFNFPYPDLATLALYLIGMAFAIITLLIMRHTSMRGATPPFIMELPAYHWPQFQSLMLHLWDKTKHFVKKAFTIILASTILIWFLQSFTWNWTYIGEEDIQNSILASLGQLITPIFTPMGFGAQLNSYGWVFAVAAITGLIAKENVIGTFGILAAMFGVASAGEAESVAIMIANTGLTWQGAFAFCVFNLLTIPCFAAVATAKAELRKGTFKWTILFWLVTSFIGASVIYVVLSWWWTIFIVLAAIALMIFGIYSFNKWRDNRQKLKGAN